MNKRLLLIYHFFHPDQVVSARIFSDLAQDLAAKGYSITVFTGNRLIRGEGTLPAREAWQGVEICRFSRPDFAQGSNFGRLLNSAILQLKWLAAFRRRRREFDAVIIGTDPQFGYLMFPWMRLFNRKTCLIHWAFDLYPEAILVNSPRWMRALATLVKPLVPWAYSRVDVMADIGECMRERLARYHSHATPITLTPWALVETPPAEADPHIRQELFGSAKIGVLYSGTVGHAHNLTPFIELARECRRRKIDVGFCFAGYGNCYAEQLAQVTAEDTNIRLAEFTTEAELAQRLAAADLHLVSLRDNWQGIVVPSKFFGALALGRPVIFSGPADSSLWHWVEQFQIGFTLGSDIGGAARDLAQLVEHPEQLAELKSRARNVYEENFSRRSVVSRWLELLTEKLKK